MSPRAALASPSGNAVTAARWNQGVATEFLARYFHPYVPVYMRTGTDALAAAIAHVLATRSGRDEVILPAYCCPDVLAAVLRCEAKPVIVDIAEDRWAYDVADLERRATSRTAAVVAVDLLGLGDCSSVIRSVLPDARIAVIQDSAQALADRNGALWTEDLVVVSFGRGKPINLLGGGAVLVRDNDAATIIRARYGRLPHLSERWAWPLAAGAFNLVQRLGIYRLANTFAMTGVGRTEFQPLTRIVGVGLSIEQVLAPALSGYLDGERSIQSFVAASAGLHIARVLPTTLGDGRLLRIPLLATNSAVRDAAVNALRAVGVGASVLYGAPLREVSGVPLGVLPDVATPGAASFARRFFTLPAHDLAAAGDMEFMAHALLDFQGRWYS